MDLNQILILFFGAGAIFLTQVPSEKMKRYACIFGLISQPSFVYETFEAGQTGMFILSLIVTISWGMGFLNYWAIPFFSNMFVRQSSINRKV